MSSEKSSRMLDDSGPLMVRVEPIVLCCLEVVNSAIPKGAINLDVSSRTPEGEPRRCPPRGNLARLDPSRPPGDATSPRCGNRLWFDAPPSECAAPNDRPPPPTPAFLQPGASVRITDGSFINCTGVVDRVLEDRGLVRLTLTIYNRHMPFELEYFQVEPWNYRTHGMRWLRWRRPRSEIVLPFAVGPDLGVRSAQVGRRESSQVSGREMGNFPSCCCPPP